MRLESGVQFDRGSIGEGMNSLANSLVSIQQRKQEDIQRNIETYKNAIDVPISDVNKDWYPSLSKEYDAYTAEASEAYRTADGNMLSREQEAQLYAKKQGLTRKINMAQNEKELLKEAYADAAKYSVTDPQRAAEILKRATAYAKRETPYSQDLTKGTTWLSEKGFDPMYGRAVDMRQTIQDLGKLGSTGDVVNRDKIIEGLGLMGDNSKTSAHKMRAVSVKLDDPNYYPELQPQERIEMARNEVDLDLIDQAEMYADSIIKGRKQDIDDKLAVARGKANAKGGSNKPGMNPVITKDVASINYLSGKESKTVQSQGSTVYPTAMTVNYTGKDGKAYNGNNISVSRVYKDEEGKILNGEDLTIQEDGSPVIRTNNKRPFGFKFPFQKEIIGNTPVEKGVVVSMDVAMKDGNGKITGYETRLIEDKDEVKAILSSLDANMANESQYKQGAKYNEKAAEWRNEWTKEKAATTQAPKTYTFSETPDPPTPQETERVKNVIRTTATEFGLDPEVALMVFGTETSGFNPYAKNPNGSAEGYAQITDDTAKEYNINKNNPAEYDSWLAQALKKKGADLLSKYPNDPYAFKLWVMGPGYLDRYDPEHPDKVIWEAGSDAAKANKALQNDDGAVTNGSFKAHMDDRFAAYKKANNIEEQEDATVEKTTKTDLQKKYSGFTGVGAFKIN